MGGGAAEQHVARLTFALSRRERRVDGEPAAEEALRELGREMLDRPDVLGAGAVADEVNVLCPESGAVDALALIVAVR